MHCITHPTTHPQSSILGSRQTGYSTPWQVSREHASKHASKATWHGTEKRRRSPPRSLPLTVGRWDNGRWEKRRKGRQGWVQYFHREGFFRAPRDEKPASFSLDGWASFLPHTFRFQFRLHGVRWMRSRRASLVADRPASLRCATRLRLGVAARRCGSGARDACQLVMPLSEALGVLGAAKASD